jgi:hypothetical protein
MSKRNLFLFLILLLVLAVGCTAPGRNDDYGPEIVLDDAAHALIKGINQHDLAQFDSYFAPTNVADPDGLQNSQALAHQLLDTTPTDTTLQLDDFAITNHYPVPEGDPVISYKAKVSLWQNDTQLKTADITQDVSFRQMADGLWKIVNADPPVVNGETLGSAPLPVLLPPGWLTETTDWYHISYPPDFYQIDDTDPAVSLITLQPTAEAMKTTPDTMFYRIIVAARPNDTLAAVDGTYEPGDLFGHGPAFEYSPDEIRDKPIQAITLDGIPAYRIDSLDGIGLTTDIITLRDNVLYEIVVEPYELGKANPQEYLPLVEQVISTFQFTQ